MAYLNGRSKGLGLEIYTLFPCCVILAKSLHISGYQISESSTYYSILLVYQNREVRGFKEINISFWYLSVCYRFEKLAKVEGQSMRAHLSK